MPIQGARIVPPGYQCNNGVLVRFWAATNQTSSSRRLTPDKAVGTLNFVVDEALNPFSRLKEVKDAWIPSYFLR